MKKSILLIPILGLMLSCSGGTTETTDTPELSDEQIEAIEESTKELDAVIESTEEAIDTLQSEVDSLLNEI